MSARLVAIMAISAALWCYPGQAHGAARNIRAANIDCCSEASWQPPWETSYVGEYLVVSMDQNLTSAGTSNDYGKVIKVVGPVQIQSTKDAYDKALVFSTALLVFVGFFQIFYLWRTVKATSDNALAARDAANAAARSVSALINSERAWLIVEMVPLCRMSGNSWHYAADRGGTLLSEDELVNGYYLRHTVKFTNMGRTPAQILRFQIGYSHLPESVTELPEGSVGDCVEAREFDHALAGTASIEVLEPIIDIFNNRGSTPEQIRAIDELRATLVVHGWVEYQHVFDSRNTERVNFCYCYSPSMHSLNRIAHPRRRQTDGDPN